MRRIGVKRAYEPAAAEDGKRLLVDRVWPRGLSREDLHIEAWLKEIAPSDELRRWFGHDAEKWDEFRRRYECELASNPETLAELLRVMRGGQVTFVYGARDETHNNAVALREFVERQWR